MNPSAFFSPYGLQWQPLQLSTPRRSQIARERLEAILESWRDTPYLSGNRIKGVGVDCVRFGVSVLDEMFRGHTEVPESVTDASLLQRLGMLQCARMVKEAFPGNRTIRDGKVEPGDLVIVGTARNRPGHLLMVGPARNTMWQATKSGVMLCGWGLVHGWQHLSRVYRVGDRERWADA